MKMHCSSANNGTNSSKKCSGLERVARPLFAALLGAWLAAGAALPAAAAEAAIPEKPAYLEMLKGDLARDKGDAAAAAAGYEAAVQLFQKLRQEQPDYKATSIQFRLDYCRQQLQSLKSGTPAPAPAGAALPAPTVIAGGPDVSVLARQNADLRAEVATLRDQFARNLTSSSGADAELKTKMRQMETAFKQLEEDRNRLVKLSNDATAERDRARTQLADTEKRDAELKASLEKTAHPDEQLKPLNEEIARLTRDMAGLAKERDRAAKNAADALADAGQAREEIKALKQAADAQESQVQALTKELKRQTKQLEPLQKDLAKTREENAARAEAVAKADQDVKAARAELEALRKQSQSGDDPTAPLRKEIEKLQKSAADTLGERDQALSKQSTLEAHVKQLQSDLAAAQDALKTLQKDGEGDARLAPLQKNIRELNDQLAGKDREIAKVQKQLESALKVREESAAQTARRQEDLKKAQDDLAFAVEQNRKMQKTLESDEKVAPLQKEIRQLQQQLEEKDKGGSLAAKSLEDARGQTAKLAAELETVRAELKALQAQATSKEDPTAPLRKEMDALVAEKRLLEKRNESLKAMLESKVQATRDDRKSADDQLAALKSDAENARKESKLAAKSEAALNKAVEKLQAENATLQAKLEAAAAAAIGTPAAPAPAPAPEPAKVETPAPKSAPAPEAKAAPENKAAPAPGASALLEQAAKDVAAKELDGAQSKFELVLKDDPKNPLALYGLAQLYLARNDVRHARRTAERLVRAAPDQAEYQHFAGMAAATDRATRDAVAYLSSAAQLAPQNAVFHRDLAVAQYAAGKLDAAVAEYRKTVELNPKDGQSFFNLAVLLVSLEPPQTDEAKKCYDTAVKLGEAKDEAIEKKLNP